MDLEVRRNYQGRSQTRDASPAYLVRLHWMHDPGFNKREKGDTLLKAVRGNGTLAMG